MKLAGILWSWFKGDAVKKLTSVNGLTIKIVTRFDEVPSLITLETNEIERRFINEDKLFIAYLDDVAVSVGWSAKHEASFGEPPHKIIIPSRNRYLRGFLTAPEFRGRGIYPLLLQAIIESEIKDADKFWILHQESNTASQRGIEKAGFKKIGTVYFLENGELGMLNDHTSNLIEEGARLLNLPII